MPEKEYVVNVIAHVDHGKTTFMDNVLERAGVLLRSSAGDTRALDSRKDEIERGMTMKLSPVTIWSSYEGARITFLDTPGHLEFNSLTQSTFIICDACIVVVDAVDGVTKRLKSLLKTARDADKAIILFINKIDQLFKLNIAQDEIIYRVEAIIKEASKAAETDLAWNKENIILGSAKDNWALFCSSNITKIISKPNNNNHNNIQNIQNTQNISKKQEQVSIKKALMLTRKIYGLRKDELEIIAKRVGIKKKEGLKLKCAPKDILSYSFSVFGAVEICIISSCTEKQEQETGNIYVKERNENENKKDVPEEVIGVICANTLIEDKITAILRTVKQKQIAIGDKVFVREKECVKECEVKDIILFTGEKRRVQRGSGVIGVQGLLCKKRGILVKESTKAADHFFDSLPWAKFAPMFADVITASEEDFSEVIRRVSLLSACEPGMICTVTKGKEITVISDGQLQMDKIKTDLEGLRYWVQEKSSKYFETVENGSGIIYAFEKVYRVTFCMVESPDKYSSEKYYAVPGHMHCYLSINGHLQAEIKGQLLSLLKKGPYLHAMCAMLCISIEEISFKHLNDANNLNNPNNPNNTNQNKITEKAETLQEIYMRSTPRVLINHAEVTVSVPVGHAKSASVCISKSAAEIVTSDRIENMLTFLLRVPVQEIRCLMTQIQGATKGEAVIHADTNIFFSLPAKPEYEGAFVYSVQKEKGILEINKLLE